MCVYIYMHKVIYVYTYSRILTDVCDIHDMYDIYYISYMCVGIAAIIACCVCLATGFQVPNQDIPSPYIWYRDMTHISYN